MISIENLAKVVGGYLNKGGWNIPYVDYFTKIQQYLSWYRGSVDDFHNYKVYQGTRIVGCTRATLGMAKTVCEDTAGVLLNEKIKITMAEPLSQGLIDNVFKANNFYVNANQLVEIASALGTGAFVNGVDDKRVQKIDYVHGDMIFPLSWENGKIIECAFVIPGKEDGEVYCTLILHKKNKVTGMYEIETIDLKDNGDRIIPQHILGGGQVQNKNIFYTKSKNPLFHIIKPNIVNNFDKTCPLGMSIFGNAIETLKNIDIKYDSWRNEFETGKRKIFIKSNLYSITIKTDITDANIVPVVDPTDTMFYEIEWTKDDIPIHEFSPALRDAEHLNSIDAELKLLGRKVGLGDNFYSFISGNVARTATEVVMSNNVLWRNKNKNELILNEAITGVCKSILELENIFNGGAYDTEQEIAIYFDDSVIEDTETKRKNALEDYNAGIIDRVEYYSITRGVSREIALKKIAEMDATNTMKETLSFMNGGGFDNGE